MATEKIDIETEIEKDRADARMTAKITIVVVAILMAAVGAAIPAAFWGIWYAVVGSIPKFMGFSRFWLDTIPGAFHAIIWSCYIFAWHDLYEELATEDPCCYYEPSFGEFVSTCPLFSLVGLVLAIDLVASFFWSFAAGLTAIVIFAIAAGIVVGIYKLVTDWVVPLGLVVLCQLFRVFPQMPEEPNR